MGNNESSNKDAITKAREFQQLQGHLQQQPGNPQQQQMGRVYTNQNIPIQSHSGSSLYSDPWQQQEQYANAKKLSKIIQKQEKQISGVKNELFIHKDSLKLVPKSSSSADASKYKLTFTFDSLLNKGLIRIYQGCWEKGIEQKKGYKEAQFVPLNQTAFENCQFRETQINPGQNQVFDSEEVEIDLNLFLKDGMDFTKASSVFYPIVIHMISTEFANHFQYDTIYYLQLNYSGSSQSWTPKILKQKLIIDNQVYELSEAYGLSTGRTDEANSLECVICLTNRKNTLTLPCRHVSLCSSCAQVIFTNDQKCPVCRQKIYDLIPFKVVEEGQNQQ